MKRLLALLLLLAPAALAADVEGYVYTIDGTPIAKATVIAGAQRTATADDGHFTLTAPADSIVKLEVRADNLSPRTVYALAGDPPLTVTLTQDENDPERDMTMRTTAVAPPMRAGGRTPQTPASTKRDRVLTGVVRIGKRPLANVPVTITPIADYYVEPSTVIADEKGRYRVPVAAGRYVVAPSPELAPRLQSSHANQMVGASDSPFLADTTKAAETVVDLELVATPYIRGRVVDADGKPVPRADVLAVLAGRSPLEFFYQPIVRTLPDGTFAVLKPPFEERQPVEIVVTPPRHSATRAKEAATIKLSRFDAVTVRVTDREGKPLPHAAVAYAAAEEITVFDSGVLYMPHMRRRRVSANANGEATLHLTPGSYEFAATAPAYQPRSVAEAIKKSTAVPIALEEGHAIRGRVLRGEQPVAGVDVSIVGRAANVPRGERRTQTDASGAFLFEALPRGSYDLHFFKHDEMVDKMLTIEAPGNTDVQLPPVAVLRGRVIEAESGQPVPQFFLNIEPVAQDDERRSRGRGQRGQAGSDGLFTATVPVGTYRVTAGANGYLPSEPVEAQVTENGSAPVELRLSRGATITGRVTDEEGRPLAEAHLMVVGEIAELARSARPVMRTGMLSAQSAEDGTFTITGAETGPAQLIVRRTGYVLERKTIEIEPETRADVTLRRGLGLSGVVTLNGKPVAGANVGASTSAIGSDHQAATTDDRGRFTLEGLVPARYTIHASYNEHNAELPNVDVAQRRELTIELKGEARGIIYGTVTGIPRGGKVTRAHVFAQSSNHGAEGTIDATGNYRIENAPTGTVDVTADVQVASGSGSTARKRVEVGPGQTVRLDLDITPALTISGRVTQGSGQPVGRTHLAFMSEEHGFVSAMTREDGSYEIGLPSPGHYQIHVNVEGVNARNYQTVREFRGSETFDVHVAEQVVEGIVVDAETRQPVAHAVVSLIMRGGAKQMMVSGETVTDATGRFTLHSSGSGPHLIVASAPGYSQRSEPVTLGGSETIRARFELSTARELRVRVVDAKNGTPLEAHLVIADERGQLLPVRPARTPDGSEFIFSLAPGKYRITAVTQGYAQKSVEVSAPGAAVIPLE